MREMKDSGIEWIGTLPKDWDIYPVKFFFNVDRGRVIAKTDLLDNGKYPVYSSQTENDGILGYINTYDYFGDAITWTTDGAKAGTVFFRTGKYNCTNVCGILRVKSENSSKANMKYMTYAIGMVAEQNKRYDINGFKIMSNEMAAIRFAVPIIAEQKAIADFLDIKCSEIDALTKDIEKQIEVLEDYKKSVITEAVTKGLNPNVEMKDSGIQWIGKCPKNWTLKRLKYTCKTRNIKYIPTYGELAYFALENIISWKSKFQKTDSIYDLSGSNICLKNDVVFGKLRPYLAKTYLVDFDRCCSAEFAIFYDFDGYQKYLLYLVTSKPFVETVDFSTYGTKMPRANIDFINNLMIPLPSKVEQNEILSYLERKCGDIDFIIDEKTKQLEILADYKKSLIYEYVTGKKEVV